jgi:LysR family glycine cleavage system transcriptional activator
VIRLPPLNALRAFEAAARHLSFKLAADELCVTQGAISRHISKLEDFLGIALFARLHRRVELTSGGATYLKEIQDALIRISHATTTLTARTGENTLTIKLPPTSAIWWLVPRLGRFHALYPDIQVQVTTSHIPVNFDQEEIDVAVQYSLPAGRGLTTDRLFGEVMVPVCSRELLGKAGGFHEARDVARQMLLHSIRRPTDWRRWLKVAGIADFEIEREIVFENSALTYQGAIEGVGIALAQLAFVANELSSGRLVTPLDIRVYNPEAYYLVFPRHKERLRRVDAFRAWIAEEAMITRQSGASL